MPKRAIRLLLAVAVLCSPGMLYAGEPWPLPAISIIIDDIGYRYGDDQRALALPGPVAYAVMPHAPFAAKMSGIAASEGKEVLVHVPMEASEPGMNEFLGPGALTADMDRQEFLHTLDLNLASVPGAIGVNNHMGSLLTRMPRQMEWLMESLKVHHKFYVDSVTTSATIAAAVAFMNSVPNLRRDVFLDNQQDAPDIEHQFQRLVTIAQEKGSAVAIGHPHPETIRVLGRLLPEISAYGVTLVSLQDMLAARRELVTSTVPPRVH